MRKKNIFYYDENIFFTLIFFLIHLHKQCSLLAEINKKLIITNKAQK